MSGPSKEFAKLTRKCQRMKLDVWALCGKFRGKSTHGLLAAYHRANRWKWEASLCRMFAHICDSFPFGGLRFGGYPRDTEKENNRKEENIATGGVRLVEANTNGRAPTKILAVQLGVNANEAEVVSKRTQRRQGCVTTGSMRSSCLRTSRKMVHSVANWTKRRARKKSFLEHKKRKRTVHFCHIEGRVCHLKNAELEPKIPTIQKKSRAPR